MLPAQPEILLIFPDQRLLVQAVAQALLDSVSMGQEGLSGVGSPGDHKDHAYRSRLISPFYHMDSTRSAKKHFLFCGFWIIQLDPHGSSWKSQPIADDCHVCFPYLPPYLRYDKQLHVYIELPKKTPICPVCGASADRVHNDRMQVAAGWKCVKFPPCCAGRESQGGSMVIFRSSHCLYHHIS